LVIEKENLQLYVPIIILFYASPSLFDHVANAVVEKQLVSFIYTDSYVSLGEKRRMGFFSGKKEKLDR
jgi:hypothetical protein